MRVLLPKNAQFACEYSLDSPRNSGNIFGSITGTFLIAVFKYLVSDCCFFSAAENEFLRERTRFLKTPNGENEISGFDLELKNKQRIVLDNLP
jgi:hypothetical protein